MSTRQDRGAGRTVRDQVEEILCLVPGAATAEADALEMLFSRAAGPARAGELPGEEAAVAAFRAAQAPPAPTAKRARVLASLTTLLTFKTAAAALAATSVGSLALAAGTGALPTPLTPSSHHATKSPDTTGTASTPPARTPTAAALRSAAALAAAQDRADAKAGRDRATSYAGLCTAFTSGTWDNTRAAANPAFARLLAAAPEGDVADFCQALAAQAPAARKAGAANGKAAHTGEKPPATGKSRSGSPSVGKSAGKSKSTATPAKPNRTRKPARGASTATPQTAVKPDAAPRSGPAA